MNPRSTAILALVAAVLGAFVYFYQVRGGERRREAEEEAKRLFPGLEQEDIRAIEFETSDGHAVRLEFGDAGWSLVEPLVFPADESTLSGMASALAQLASEGTIEDPQAPEVYGLGDEAKVVRFWAGDAGHVLRMGKKTPVDYNTYVSADERDTVYTVPSYRANALQRELADVRERRVLIFERSAVDRIDASWPGAGVVLERREDAWHLVSPLAAPADERTVDDLLADLSFLRADGFIDEPSQEILAGFEEPAFRIVLRAPAAEEGAPPSEHALLVGAPVEGAKRAVRGMQASLYTIPNERLEDLPRRVVDYRFRTLAHFMASDATRLELVFRPEDGGEPLVISAERGGAGWTSEPEAMASGKVSRLVSELARLRAEDIAADAMGPEELAEVGLAPPRVVIRAFGAPPEEGGERLRLAEVALGVFDANEGILAKAADQATIYRLDYGLAEHIPVSLEAFRNRFLSKEEPEGAAEAPADAPPLALPELDEVVPD